MNPERTVKWFLLEFQAYFALAARALVRIVRRPRYYREFVTQLDKMGVGSLFIVSLTGFFTGMVMALQALIQLKPFAATSYVGGMVAVTMVKELGPVLSSLMVAGRVGSSITAELGTMVVTEQVDAMRVEGTDVITRLVTSRLKAMLVAMPLLAVVTDALALLGGYIIASSYDINILMYWCSRISSKGWQSPLSSAFSSPRSAAMWGSTPAVGPRGWGSRQSGRWSSRRSWCWCAISS